MADRHDRSHDRADRAAVRDTYDQIATHFAKTREYAWPEVESFVEDVVADGSTSRDEADDRVSADGDDADDADDASDADNTADSDQPTTVGLDLGCGNCRHAELLAKTDHFTHVLGVDVSRGLLETGRDRARERDFTVSLCQGDAAELPLATDAVDSAVYVATLHHLPTPAARQASLDELGRVLAPAPDGRALVSAWSTAHDRFDEDELDTADGTGFDTTIEWTLPGGETVDRFYHIYTPEEFERDLAASSLEVLEWEVSSGNCYAVVAGADESDT
ncbi:putative S-adenosylmethionine-dependent methyltransferase [Natrialba magadii ATCC 43099]|uniref:S-adenosylmethionine-dependent methyltransferase n=1 Tax=Natrialba magadii (strain ATCC 43099 / DSM 3394 / CCM 3739 / CIP 104546 / IAM 13178 / JCM 8861 / NBRC 102185 / NCIMB 2190 / MS3) TaxID=547559 RepID=D3SS00_NATMM|nr:class I SAM-dependent methyltransferase [Natrialba magadii]ADD06774.1 putative S-adenosylmethionine-dependent methyltransferase [Natrialba magadii ATCC 43099]ELY27790.1 type 11 methyltransferase [Natrialba magadii ATCC 43099]